MKRLVIASALFGLSLGVFASDMHDPRWSSPSQRHAPYYDRLPYHGQPGLGVPRAGRLLRDMDANRNGMLSRSEIGDHRPLQRRFHALDVNHDGQLSRHELRALVDISRPHDRFWERSN